MDSLVAAFTKISPDRLGQLGCSRGERLRETGKMGNVTSGGTLDQKALRRGWTACMGAALGKIAKGVKKGKLQTSAWEAIKNLREPSPEGRQTGLDSLCAALRKGCEGREDGKHHLKEPL